MPQWLSLNLLIWLRKCLSCGMIYLATKYCEVIHNGKV
jgi:hypothetical protein